jgi:N-acylglucosamine 2-epimerase/mannose-6-phosphate isomerase
MPYLTATRQKIAIDHGWQADTAVQRASRWMLDCAIPLWARSGVDRKRGGYVEQMAFDGSARPVDFKRTRVIGRQIYVFSHAALLGRKDALECARFGHDFLTRNAWLGPDGGWARLLTPDGGVKDATPDLYDLAFILYAFGWYRRASGDEAVDRWALRTLDFIETHMRHPGGQGFLVEKPASGARLQNPHMHLLEAALINLEASGDARFRRLADEIVELFATRFFDPRTSTLGEQFDERWNRLRNARGRAIEPGHQFEWAWILARYQRLTGCDMRPFVEGLTWFAETHGVEHDDWLTLSAVRDDGVVIDAGSRVWPNTERIQAAVAMFELFGIDPRPVFASSTRVLFDHFLDRGHSPDRKLAGTWMDRIDAERRPVTDHVPASTLYHLMIAFAEMIRIAPEVEDAFPS